MSETPDISRHERETAPRIGGKSEALGRVTLVLGVLLLLAVIYSVTGVMAEKGSCIANLKQLDAAKEQWAMDHSKGIGAVPGMTDLVGADAYVRSEPRCGIGGRYVLGPVGTPPICRIPGHSLK